MSEDPEAIKAAARRTLEQIFPTVDEAGLAEVIHPDCVNHEAPPGAPQGLEGMTRSMHMLAAALSDRRWEIHQAIAEGDTVVLHCTFSGRHTGHFMGLAPTNRPFAYRQVHIIRFQDGRGIEHWAVRDDLNFLRQVGALPSQPARPVPADAQVGWLGSAWVAQASHQDPTQRRIRRAMPACCRLRWCAGVVALAAVKGCWPGCGRPLLAAGGALPLPHALGGGAGRVPGGPLGRLARHRAERWSGR